MPENRPMAGAHLPKAVGGRKPRSKTTNWSDPMTDWLIVLVDKPENGGLIRGKAAKGEKTSGKTKATVFQRIASDPAVLRELWLIDAIEAGRKAQSKFDNLSATYREKRKRLTATGSGVENETLSGDEGNKDALRQVELDYYIEANGPDESTPLAALNIWNQITSEFKWFPAMHKLFLARPNQVPIAVTTGVGPNGPQMVLHQPGSCAQSQEWDDLDFKDPEVVMVCSLPQAGPSTVRGDNSTGARKSPERSWTRYCERAFRSLRQEIRSNPDLLRFARVCSRVPDHAPEYS